MMQESTQHAARARPHADAVENRHAASCENVGAYTPTASVYSLQGAHAQCRLITEYCSDMLSVHGLDDAFTYLYASPAAKRLFGYDAAELVGRSALDFIHPDDRSHVQESAARLRERNDVVSATFRFRSRAGAYTWVESTCRLVPTPDSGVPVEIIATTRSAEARVAAEMDQAHLLADASAARAAAEAANRTKDEFLAMMSHEFRTPLNAIAGHVEIMQLGLHGPLTDAQRHALGRIDRSQRYLLRLVNDILNLERLRSGRLTYDIRPVRVARLLDELEPMIGPQLAARSLSYVVQLGDGDVVLADRERLSQVLINLISNAVKFTPEGGTVTIDCPERADGTTPRDLCFIRVRDTGVGIPDGKQATVFEPFVQVDVLPSRRAEGAGLGLAIGRDLSRGMGGELRVRSVEGAGASFTITLPRGVVSGNSPANCR
jgi:PAS domain S-box-containing protein